MIEVGRRLKISTGKEGKKWAGEVRDICKKGGIEVGRKL